MLQLAEPLRARGFDTIGLVPEGAQAVGRLRQAGLEVVELPLGRLRATMNPLRQARFLGRIWPEARAIRRLLRERDIELVQAHGPTNPHAGIAAHREGVPIVWQIYDTRAPMFVRRPTMALVVRLADAIMTTGHEVARVHPGALGLGERLVTYVPPVDTGRFHPDPARRTAARAELGLPEDAFAVVAVGNLNPQKGHEFLIRAAARIREAEPGVLTRILGASAPGHDSYEAGLREEAQRLGLADGRLEFFDAGPRVAELLPAFDVLALTSVPRSEGIPTVVLEAMASGLPVVTTEVGAVGEIVREGETGFIVPPEQPDSIARAILHVMRDRELARAMGERARRDAVERYDLERCAERHVHAYELALAHRAGRPR